MILETTYDIGSTLKMKVLPKKHSLSLAVPAAELSQCTQLATLASSGSDTKMAHQVLKHGRTG